MTTTTDAYRVYLGNLARSVHKEDLEEFVGEEWKSKLQDVWIARNPPGFGYVQFTSLELAESFIAQFNQTDLKGNTIKVELAKSKKGAPAKGTTRGNERGKRDRSRGRRDDSRDRRRRRDDSRDRRRDDSRDRRRDDSRDRRRRRDDSRDRRRDDSRDRRRDDSRDRKESRREDSRE